MIVNTLSQTLVDLADGATPQHPGLSVTEAEVTLPLIVSVQAGANGPIVVAHPPWSAFRSGIEPVAHRARMTFHEVPHEGAPNSNPATGPNEAT